MKRKCTLIQTLHFKRAITLKLRRGNTEEHNKMNKTTE